MSIQNLLRENIRKLKAYSSAREEEGFKTANIYLDANENGFYKEMNRYPDPLQRKLKKEIANWRNVSAKQVFLGNGSDEIIDLFIRAFCEPGKESILVNPPTYGMYEVCANVNAVEVEKVNLTSDFQLDVTSIWDQVSEKTKLIFICSPNNPTGNRLKIPDIVDILTRFNGLVILDEAYVDFSIAGSLLPLISQFKNLVVLQTLSKAWGLAGIRLGMAFADQEIVEALTKIKFPYNVNSISQQIAYNKIKNERDDFYDIIQRVLRQRNYLVDELSGLSYVQKVYPSDANFLLVKVDQPGALFVYLRKKQILIRDRSKEPGCEGCVRITVGKPSENKKLLAAMKEYEKSSCCALT